MIETGLLKLFHSYGDMFDDVHARRFYQVYQDADSMLLVNQANPVCSLCEWISGHDVDLGKHRKLFRRGLPVVVNAKEGVNVTCGKMKKSVIGSTAVLETNNAAPIEPQVADIRRMSAADSRCLDHMENDYEVHDMIVQFKELLSEPCGTECFGLFVNGALAAIMDIGKPRGSLFEGSYTVGNVFTAQPFREKGLAAALLRHVLREHAGSPFYYDATPSDNIASVNLALRYGFTLVGKTVCYQFS